MSDSTLELLKTRRVVQSPDLAVDLVELSDQL